MLKGTKHTQQTKEKMRLASLGINNAFFGKTHTKEIRERIRKARKGIKLSKETRMKMSQSRKGKIFSEERKKNMSNARKENKCYNWKGGCIMWCSKKANIVYREHHINVICEQCGNPNNICIHHKDRNRKNNNIDNLQALCRSCHATLHLTGMIKKEGRWAKATS